MDLRLPGKRSGGVHVFHNVFQRLPQKHMCFGYICIRWHFSSVAANCLRKGRSVAYIARKELD